MSNPRANVRFSNVNRHYTAVQFDSSVNLPSITNGNNLSVSTDQNAVVTQVGTATYANDNGSILVGKGSSGDPIYGQIVRVDPDGFGSVQDQGYIEALCDSTVSPTPAVNDLCAVNGAGKVIRSTAAKNANAKCVGYADSVNLNIFQHQQGTISPPTPTAKGPEVIIVQLL